MSNAIYLVLGTSAMVLMMFAIILFIYLFQRKLAARAKAYSEIEKMMQKQELQSIYALIEGQEQERKRIAGELHDNIGGLLATLKIYSDLTLEKSEITDIQRLNNKINTISENLSDEARKLSHQLDLRTLSGFGFKTAVQQLCEAINGSGKLVVIPVFDIQKPINENIALNLYRIIQELFTNTLKHAVATQTRLEINLIENEITVIYEDDGKGFNTDSVSVSGMGLKNISSRVNMINGKLTVDSPSRGTTFIIELTNHE
jgi:two-component system NarL family sensor kinase